MGVNIINEDCEVGVATDKTLPYTAYLVEYVKEERDDKKTTTRVAYDLVISGKAADIFDHYYDKYKKNFKGMKQAEGRANPTLWPPKGPSPTKKRRKKKEEKEDE